MEGRSVTLRIEIVDRGDRRGSEGLNQLLPQLSSTARRLTTADDRRARHFGVDDALHARDEDEKFVGTLTLVVFRIPTGLRGWIEDVVVDESARGLGVGEALTVAAIQEAKERGVRSLDLTTRPTRESANRLYARLGFERRETNVYRYQIET